MKTAAQVTLPPPSPKFSHFFSGGNDYISTDRMRNPNKNRVRIIIYGASTRTSRRALTHTHTRHGSTPSSGSYKFNELLCFSILFSSLRARWNLTRSVFFFFVGVRMWAVLPNYKILNLLHFLKFLLFLVFSVKSHQKKLKCWQHCPP